MEVRDQRIDCGESIRRRDVKVGPSRSRIRAGGRLEHPYRRRADRDDPVSGCHRLTGRIRHLVPLAMDSMLVDELALERPEGVEPDMERYRCAANATGFE